jgi:hypothetical protein
MIATAKPVPREQATPSWHQPFVQMLPAIQRHARIAFRHLDAEARAEAEQEVTANALLAFVRLVELGKADLAYATPLAMYGVRQFRAGRRVGGKLNVRDISSRHCQRVKGVQVGRLDHFDEAEGQWKEILLEDRRAGPAETACCRIDFAAWLRSLSHRNRKIATTLATGESTGVTAKRFNVSSGRISQLRRELKESWEAFQGQQAELSTAQPSQSDRVPGGLQRRRGGTTTGRKN